MKFLTVGVLSALFIAVLANNTTTAPETPPTTHPTSSSTESTSSSTTPSSTTTETTTTPKSSTTTEATTTPKSSTTTEATTTPKSSTTTESPSTTTVKPSPKPDSKPTDVPKIMWNVTENENITCIRAVMKLYFELSVDKTTKYIVVDGNASDSESRCMSQDNEEQLVLDFPGHYNFTMVFVNDSNTIYVNETTLTYDLHGQIEGKASTNEKLFTVSAGRSYLCNSESVVKLGENVTMYLSEVHIQAFNKEVKNLFGDAQECDKDDKVSDAIPIAVGIALAALIIIVLIAYLVGRRQSRQRGYQSV